MAQALTQARAGAKTRRRSMPRISHERYADEYIAEILGRARAIAMVGASGTNNRPSYFAMKYLLGKGYRVIPVSPGLAGQPTRGQPVLAGLADGPPAVG